jgi:hypothetical protein
MISPCATLLQRGYSPKLVCGFLAASIFLTAGLQGLAQFPALSQSSKTPLSLVQTASPTFRTAPVNVSAQAVQHQDPLNSAYPVPWAMIWENQTKATQTGKVLTLRSLSKAVISPDGLRQAHSEINVQLNPEITKSYVSSNLIIADAKGKVLQSVPSTMHLGNNLSDGKVEETTAIPIGTLSILMPAAWSKDGQQLLTRQFEAVLGSDVSSDYALVWDRKTQVVKTVTPTPQTYDTAILLGWSPRNPNQILFRTTILGEQNTDLVAVTHDGTTTASKGDPTALSIGTMKRPAAEARR